MSTSDRTPSEQDRIDRSSAGPDTRPASAPAPRDGKPDQLDPNEEDARNRQEALIDESVEETFPASDPATPKRIT